MLPLLWLLLWTPKLGLSSSLTLWDMLVRWSHDNIPSRYTRACERVIKENIKKDPMTSADSYEDHVSLNRMVDINNEIYKQFGKYHDSVYMVFNKTKLREAVPEPSLLCLAELHLLRRRKPQAQLLKLIERYRGHSFRYISHHSMAPSRISYWVSFDVTKVVRRWLKQEEPIEVFLLWSALMSENKENAFHMDISGLTPRENSDYPDDDNRLRPFLFLLTTQKKQTLPKTAPTSPDTQHQRGMGSGAEGPPINEVARGLSTETTVKIQT